MSFELYENNNPRPGKGPRTIILDLDETMLHSFVNHKFVDDYQIYTNPHIFRQFHPKDEVSITYSLILKSGAKIWGLKRPYFNEFLEFSMKYFDNIIVWSAGTAEYVNEITSQIFPFRPKLVWARDKCSKHNDNHHKPINQIISELSSRPYETFKVDLASTLILDDKQYTFTANYSSGVLCPQYNGGCKSSNKIPTMNELLDRSDDALLKFMRWLDKPEVKNAEDVRLLDKSRIFDS